MNTHVHKHRIKTCLLVQWSAECCLSKGKWNLSSELQGQEKNKQCNEPVCLTANLETFSWLSSCVIHDLIPSAGTLDELCCYHKAAQLTYDTSLICQCYRG